MSTLPILALLGLLVPQAQASDPKTREEAAQGVAEAWLTLVDTPDCGKSWEQAARLFKNAVTSEQWCQALKAVREPLGPLKTRTFRSATFQTSLPGAPDGKYVVILYDTVFANKAAAVETVTPMLDPEGVWRVGGYYIR